MTSPAFDLGNASSIELEIALREFNEDFAKGALNLEMARNYENRFRLLLGEADPFWIRWRYIAEKNGWNQ